MEAKGITREQNSSAVIVGKNGVGPMQIWSAEKFESMGHATAGINTQIKDITRFNRPGTEGSVHLIFKELDGHLGGNDLDLRIAI